MHEQRPRLIENWFTKKIKASSYLVTSALIVLLFGVSLFDWLSVKDLAVSYDQVYLQHHYYKLWTALFAHADLGHLLGNALLFIPFALLLTGYFNFTLFPLVGILSGGFINALTLTTLLPEVQLMGISGVVNWMGAVWLTLFILVDRRTGWRKRFAVALFSSLVLFAPQEFKPEISYLSHIMGFALGIVCGLIYYALHKQDFLAAEVYETVLEFEE